MDELITNRTQEDVLRWRELHDKGWPNMTYPEKLEWLGYMPGRYTAVDLNRVERAVEIIAGRLNEIGYLTEELFVKKTWNDTEIPALSELRRYFENVKKIQKSINLPNVPEAPTIKSKFDWRSANDIEKILDAADKAYLSIVDGWYYSNEIMSGEV